ncbi:phosphate ABC transporter substrate-binding protein [Clostridium beijerinckii]|nr:phosphate ABC transporter substrate-binding protein [Clostridium beijerinckii]
MKKRTLKLMVNFLVIVMIGSVLVGCGNNSARDAESITIGGSSALLPLMEQSIEKFNKKNPNEEIGAQAGGSGTGLAQVLNGTIDVGNSDVLAEAKLGKENAEKLVDHKVVAQGFCVVVNKSLGIDNLTSEQLKDIFSGKATNWKDVGGADKEILLVHRTAGSGTRATFENTILDGNKSLENDSLGITQDSNGAVLSVMKENEGAISYLGLSYMNSKEAQDLLTLLKIDGVASDKANIIDGSYKFWSWGHMYTKGEATGLSKKFIEFVASEDNRSSAENLGFILGTEMKVK